MFQFDIERVRVNVQKATTEDLLDRITVYRSALDPQAIETIIEELRRRNVSADEIVAHEQARGEVLCDDSGTPRVCSNCLKPAVISGWGWHRLYGKIPIFPRTFYWCAEHAPNSAQQQTDAT
jgi:hypothetical protein